MFLIRGKDVFLSLDLRSYSRMSYSEQLEDDRNQTDEMTRSLLSTGEKKFIPNLNMISAMTHIMGDTLRSSSVFIAAFISEVFNQDSTLCDAWAAVIVTITIIMAVIPLIFEIIQTYKKISVEFK